MPELNPLFKIQQARFKSNSPTIATESKALIQHVRRVPAQRWEFTLKSVPLYPDVGRKVWAFITALNGRFEPFDVVIPGYSQPQGVASGAPTVRTAAAAGVTSVAMQGFSGPVTGQLLAGDYVRFGNHSKVYMVTADVNSNVSGQLTLPIYPQLARPVTLGTPLIVNNVPFTVRQLRDMQEFSVSGRDGRITTFELDCIEAL
jgi:hypothetical protein